jgi:hypothetical protein
MQPFFHFSTTHKHMCSLFLLILFIAPNLRAGDFIQVLPCSRDVAFARYLAALEERDPFRKSEPVGILIEASLGELYKSAGLLAVRTQRPNEPGEVHVLQIAGDGTVVEEVIQRYFMLREQFDSLPLSSIAITPANYKFHFAGEVKTEGGGAYIYDITPKKNRPGMLIGRLWIDSATGHEIMLTGHLLHLPATAQPIDIVRDTKMANGSVYARVTHAALALPQLGRAEVVITEMLLPPEGTSGTE